MGAVAVTVLVGQLSVGWANDWRDAARDTATGRADKPLVTRPLLVPVVRRAALIALTLSVPLSLLSGPRAALAHLAAVGAAWAYDLGVKATLASPLPYVLAFGLLPAFLTLGLPGAPAPPAWAVVGAALLGLGAHLANVLPDIEDDLATGVRGLPQRLGAPVSAGLAASVLLAAVTVLLLGPSVAPRTWVLTAAVAAAAGATAALLGSRGRPRPGPDGPPRPTSRQPFRLTLLLAALAVGTLLARGDVLSP